MITAFLRAGLCVCLLPGVIPCQEALATIDPRPLVEIGHSDVDPADQLFAVSSARFLSDGSIVVAERHDARARMYDARGRHLVDLGGKGPGPGELSGGLIALAVGKADTVLMLDEGGARLRYLASGRLIDHTPLRLPQLADARFNLVSWGILPGGEFLLKGNERLFGASEGMHSQHFMVLVLSPRSGRLDTLGVFAEQDVMVRRGMPWPAAPVTPIAWAAGAGSDLWLGSARDDVIRRYAIDGELRVAIERHQPRSEVTDADIGEMVTDMVRRGATPNDRRVIREWATALPRADHAPAFRGIFVDRMERLWVERWPRTREGLSQWDVYAPSGHRVLTALGPKGLRITDARAGAVVGVGRDEDDRELVRVHPLRAP